jgi:hypothetical protein
MAIVCHISRNQQSSVLESARLTDGLLWTYILTLRFWKGYLWLSIQITLKLIVFKLFCRGITTHINIIVTFRFAQCYSILQRSCSFCSLRIIYNRLQTLVHITVCKISSVLPIASHFRWPTAVVFCFHWIAQLFKGKTSKVMRHVSFSVVDCW